MQQMVIANRLSDGIVVFLAAGDAWVTSIEDGAVIEGDADAERALEVAKRQELECLVVDPSLIEVELTEGRPKPKAIRELIRAFGPTVGTEVEAGERAAAATSKANPG